MRGVLVLLLLGFNVDTYIVNVVQSLCKGEALALACRSVWLGPFKKPKFSLDLLTCFSKYELLMFYIAVLEWRSSSW